ncbi:MAG: conjugative transposon protein TraM [Bacteroidia bacterium]
MGKKALDNKKLTKTLIIAGCGLLFLFMILRLFFRSTGISEAENPDIKNIDNGKINLPKEKTSIEKLEAQERKKNQPTSEQKNNYVYHDFDKMLKETGTEKPEEPMNEVKNNNTETKSVNAPPQASKNENYNNYNNIAVQQGNGEKINQKQETKTETPQSTSEAPKKSVFGTVRREETTLTNTVTLNHFEGKKAEIYGDQKITNGGPVLIRNKEKIVTEGGLVIPQNSIITGQASFTGNRVEVKLNKVQTKDGTYNIDMYVLDHDNIEGITYQAPVDQVAGNAADNTNTPYVYTPPNIAPGIGNVITGVVSGTARAAKDLIKKTRSLELTDGYNIYIIPKSKK